MKKITLFPSWKQFSKWSLPSKASYISFILCIIFFMIGTIVIPILTSRISDNKADIRKKQILAGLKEMLERETVGISEKEIEVEAKRTFEISKNFNANFTYKKGYEKKGGLGLLQDGRENQTENSIY